MRAKTSLLALSFFVSSVGGCSEDGAGGPSQGREEGQTDFQSAPPASQGGGGGGTFGAGTASDSKAEGAPAAPSPAQGTAAPKPEETDIYRVDGDRLYFLNSYRGLLVFDITNADDPKLLGRSPVYGTPVEMFVQNGIATMVLGDWYGNAPDGTPFHGSVVRTVDARNPAAMKIEGEVQVKGWARDMRVVGNSLFIVSEDYGWHYGVWYYGGYYGGGGDVAVAPGGMYGGYGSNSKVVISSVSFGDHAPVLKGTKEFDGYSGAFNVTSNAILMAHDVLVDGTQGGKQPNGKASIDYIAFSNIDGSILPMGSFQVDGLLNGAWTADNGRWNVDLDGNIASVITCQAADYGYCNGQGGYKVTTIDFTDASAPKQLGALSIPSKGWAATARFSNKRMYLSPREGSYSPNGGQQPTPFEVYDLSTPTAPKLAGSTNISGAVWLFMPAGTDRVFALGNDYGDNYSSSQVSVRLLDVADPTQPKLLGTSKFGNGWAWTPASGTFKAFTRDDAQKLVVLPFSGWSRESYEYMNGVQLIEYDTGSITTKGSARSKGWVERGIFVKNRLVSLSDQSLSVIDYADRTAPKVIKEMTLARNVVSAEPNGATIAQLSTDWYGYDQQKSELRVLPIANAEENVEEPNAKSVAIDGTNARVFRNGDLAYVVTTLYPKNPNGPYYTTPHVQVVDLAGGGATPRGTINLPQETDGNYWAWWGGCYYWDWYDGSNAVQVGGNALAFKRTRGSYDPQTGRYQWDQKLYVIDLSNPDAPKLSSTTITPDGDSWWGNMKVVGNTLYTTHYEWVEKPVMNPATGNAPQKNYWVKYYLDQVDITDRANPKIGKRINVPGLLVGASEADPSLLYFVDYRWYQNYDQGPKDEIAVARIKDDKAYLQSSTLIDGWVGNVFVRGTKAYTSAQTYPVANSPETPKVQLHEIDLTDPKKPVDRPAAAKDGWGWLVDVEGDRAIITSGWGQVGLDIYKLTPGQPPIYSQFARTRGWWSSAMSRQADDLFLSSGYWGVQKISLK